MIIMSNSQNLSSLVKFLGSFCSSSGQHIYYSKGDFFSVDDSISFIRKDNSTLMCICDIIYFCLS